MVCPRHRDKHQRPGGVPCAVIGGKVGRHCRRGTVSHAFFSLFLLVRGTIVNRTYGTHKNLPGICLNIFTITGGHS